jgi:hypothetical protein
MRLAFLQNPALFNAALLHLPDGRIEHFAPRSRLRFNSHTPELACQQKITPREIVLGSEEVEKVSTNRREPFRA